MIESAIGVGLFLLLGLAQYRTTHHGELARHPTRRRILDHLEKHPGISLGELRRKIGCSWGTIHHHVCMLQREQLVRSERWNRSRRLFPACIDPGRERPFSLLQSGRVREVVEEVLASPGLIQRDITEGVGMSRKVLRNYLDLLKDEGLLREVPVSRTRTYFPTRELETAVARLGRSPADAGQAESSDLDASLPARRPTP